MLYLRNFKAILSSCKLQRWLSQLLTVNRHIMSGFRLLRSYHLFYLISFSYLVSWGLHITLLIMWMELSSLTLLYKRRLQ
jgi:hypothetical protein